LTVFWVKCMKEEVQILNTWNLNAKAWINTIANNGIESRRVVTNKAIEEAIVSLNPEKILDLGCGEGWLIRALQKKLPKGDFTGLDAVPVLIYEAKTLSPNATFLVHSYQSIIQELYSPLTKFDAIAINFALFGEEIVSDLVKVIRPFISSGGHLVIQTLHPHTAHAESPYADGWRQGSWNGFSDDFTSPAPWFFRTLESWISLFTNNGYSIKKILEPVHPVSLQPVSVIFILSV
jgi:2-polyprenyl-3-methyl-5-hydroxy-6-metoxy-1,4-benzoquinol methylase